MVRVGWRSPNHPGWNGKKPESFLKFLDPQVLASQLRRHFAIRGQNSEGLAKNWSGSSPDRTVWWWHYQGKLGFKSRYYQNMVQICQICLGKFGNTWLWTFWNFNQARPGDWSLSQGWSTNKMWECAAVSKFKLEIFIWSYGQVQLGVSRTILDPRNPQTKDWRNGNEIRNGGKKEPDFQRPRVWECGTTRTFRPIEMPHLPFPLPWRRWWFFPGQPLQPWYEDPQGGAPKIAKLVYKPINYRYISPTKTIVIGVMFTNLAFSNGGTTLHHFATFRALGCLAATNLDWNACWIRLESGTRSRMWPYVANFGQQMGPQKAGHFQCI